MDAKTKKIGRLRRFFFRLLGPSLSKKIICRALRKWIDKSPASFPADLNRSSDILFILPADRVEMTFQLESLFSIIGKYKGSALTFVCPGSHGSFVSGFPNARVIRYDPDDFLLYSAEHNRLAKKLSERAFDICVMLEKNYTLAHLYLAGISRAHLRIGWEGGNAGVGSYPFLNVRLVASRREGVNLWERNLEVAKILNVSTVSKMRWGVQESTLAEVGKILSEHKLERKPALICIDLASLESGCGQIWSAELMRSLKESKIGHFCIYSGSEDARSGFKDVPFPVLPPMSASRVAALMEHTDAVIAGVGALLGLAQISANKIVPVLTKEQAEMYCKRNDSILPALLSPSQKPDGEAVRAVIKNIKMLLAK